MPMATMPMLRRRGVCSQRLSLMQRIWSGPASRPAPWGSPIPLGPRGCSVPQTAHCTTAPPHPSRFCNTVVLDSAYAPLRLGGTPSLSEAQRAKVWPLFSPNKALGLTGVRAAYAIAPFDAQQAATQLHALAPSWVLGAHGVALLMAWTQADTQDWLHSSLQTLRGWKQRQVQALQALGWTVQPSDTPFFCAQPLLGVDAVVLCAQLRTQGIKLRDATSFGLPGWVRLGVLPPQAQDALRAALQTTVNKGQA